MVKRRIQYLDKTLMSIYKDYPHKIKILDVDGKKLIEKSTEDTKIHKREFDLQDLLSNKIKSVPSVYNYNDKFFHEDFIHGKTFNELAHAERIKYIPLIAETISKIHKISVDKKAKEVFDLKEDFKYKPLWVLDLIIGNDIDLIKNNTSYKDILEFTQSIENLVESIDYEPSIIHGDLSGNNIIIGEDGIYIIDWTDSRIDLGLCDLMQFVHLTNLDKEEEALLLKHYDDSLKKTPLLKLLKIFFKLYDFIDINKKENRISEEIKSDIERLLNE